MWPIWAFPLLIVLVTVCAMELVANLVHRHIMHGFGWEWHSSHHEPHRGRFERNDYYALIFAALSICFFTAGGTFRSLWWVGLGMVVYGLLYALLHDVLVHQRLPAPITPRSGYLKRLVQAHRLHHAVRARDGAVSFGFLYAPPVHSLVGQLKAQRFGSGDESISGQRDP